MTSTTVADFAAELNKPTELLLEQLSSAGVSKRSGGDTVSESDKQSLLHYLKVSHGTAGGERKKITLVKKTTSEKTLPSTATPPCGGWSGSSPPPRRPTTAT